MNYGLPYKGSKNKIAKEIVEQLPAAKHFYDLFAGGCAVTHAAMLSGKYKTFTINDIHHQIVQLFVDAVNGKYRDEKRIISRDDFDRLKNSDEYVAICWSFGNNGHGYLWNSETEKAKLLACKMILADSVRERWQAYRDFIKYLQSVRTELQRRRENKERLRAELGDIEYGIREELRRYLEESGKTRADIDRILGTNGMAGHYFSESQWEFPTEEKYEQIRAACPNFPPYDYWGERLQSLESLERLQGLESLERLQGLESLQSLERLQGLESLQSLQSLESLQSLTGDYQSIAIMPDSVVYCDPPYRGTSGYKTAFDHDRFYDWLRSVPFPVYVSEYAMPDDFVQVWQTEKICTLGAHNNTRTIERLFLHRKWAEQHQPTREPDLFSIAGKDSA